MSEGSDQSSPPHESKISETLSKRLSQLHEYVRHIFQLYIQWFKVDPSVKTLTHRV